MFTFTSINFKILQFYIPSSSVRVMAFLLTFLKIHKISCLLLLERKIISGNCLLSKGEAFSRKMDEALGGNFWIKCWKFRHHCWWVCLSMWLCDSSHKSLHPIFVLILFGIFRWLGVRTLPPISKERFCWSTLMTTPDYLVIRNGQFCRVIPLIQTPDISY